MIANLSHKSFALFVTLYFFFLSLVVAFITTDLATLEGSARAQGELTFIGPTLIHIIATVGLFVIAHTSKQKNKYTQQFFLYIFIVLPIFPLFIEGLLRYFIGINIVWKLAAFPLTVLIYFLVLSYRPLIDYFQEINYARRFVVSTLLVITVLIGNIFVYSKVVRYNELSWRCAEEGSRSGELYSQQVDKARQKYRETQDLRFKEEESKLTDQWWDIVSSSIKRCRTENALD